MVNMEDYLVVLNCGKFRQHDSNYRRTIYEFCATIMGHIEPQLLLPGIHSRSINQKALLVEGILDHPKKCA